MFAGDTKKISVVKESGVRYVLPVVEVFPDIYWPCSDVELLNLDYLHIEYNVSEEELYDAWLLAVADASTEVEHERIIYFYSYIYNYCLGRAHANKRSASKRRRASYNKI